MARPRAVLVTGMSGAGRTTCLKMLEDLGYEAVDNLPVGLLARVFRPAGAGGGPPDVAVGMDSRTRDFEPRRLLRELRALRGGPGAAAAAAASPFLLFFDCEDAELQRRFSASRRRHPLADDLPVEEALGRERALMAPLRDEADLVIDTTGLAPPDLRRLLAGHFGPGAGPGRLGIAVVSFSYKRGLPRDADLVLDVRFLRNPHYVGALRPLTGLDPEVQAHVRDDPDLEPFLERLQALLAPLLPRYEAEGKSYLTIALGCTGGQHRSVYLAERLAGWLRAQGREAAVRHRDIPGGGTPAEAR
jgi:RNase adapter protein RapZ